MTALSAMVGTAPRPAELTVRMAALLDLDAERLRLWLFARCVVGAFDWPELLAVAMRMAPA